MIYQFNLRYSLLVEGLFHYNAHFIITFFSLGSHHERYNEVALHLEWRLAERNVDGRFQVEDGGRVTESQE